MTNKDYELEDLLKHNFAEESRCPVFKEEKIFFNIIKEISMVDTLYPKTVNFLRGFIVVVF